MKDSLSALLNTFDNIKRAWAENRGRIPDFEERVERLKRVREYAVEHSDELWRLAARNLEENNIRVCFPSDESAALEILLEEIGDEKLVVKSKSNVTKHLRLAEWLEERGVEVVETDIGDRMVQLAGTLPSHPTCPAAHLDRYEMAQRLSRYLQRPVPAEPEVMLALLREEIAGKIARSRLGITGANAVCAEEGSVVLVHNEGNILKVATQTKKHIIITGKDKIYPRVDDAINMVKILTYFGTGHAITSYVDIISGPSKTADIESMLFSGVHGPEEIILIVVDTLKERGFKYQQLYHCIGCGGCLVVCPSYRAVGNAFGEGSHLGGIGIARISAENPTDKLYYCTTCDLCRETCPLQIPAKDILLEERKQYLKQHQPLKAHERIISSVARTGRVFEERVTFSEVGGQAEFVYFRGCMATLRRREISTAAEELLRKSGTSYAVIDERCCGSPLLKIGCEIGDLVEYNVSRIEETGAGTLLFTCPGCLEAFRSHYPAKYRLLHISEYIAEQIAQGALSLRKSLQVLSYHKPCHLKVDVPEEIIRHLGVYLPLERGCCGAGGGVRSAYPEISQRIAEQRRREARETGASTLITACPFCKEQLEGGEQRVEDLVEFLNRAIR
jgi:L-lactate dehydrogenase complex protein LldG